MNKELAYWVATSAIPGVGSATFNYLLRYFKRLQKFWEAPYEKINKLKVDSKTRESILAFRQKVDRGDLGSQRLPLESRNQRL